MEVVITFETSVNFYQITRRSNPEDAQLHNGYQNTVQFLSFRKSDNKNFESAFDRLLDATVR